MRIFGLILLHGAGVVRRVAGGGAHRNVQPTLVLNKIDKLKHFVFRHWFKFAFLLAAAVALFAVPAAAHELTWHKSTVREPSPVKPVILEVDRFPEGCYRNRIPGVASMYGPLGCYIPWSKDQYGLPNPGYILLAKRLSPWVRKCVVEHEEKHDAGFDHDDGWGDCK